MVSEDKKGNFENETEKKNIEETILEDNKDYNKKCKGCCIIEHFKKDNGFRRSQILTFHALISAVIVVFTVYLTSIGTLQLAFIPIFAVILSANFLGLKHGIISGLVFGLTSLILSIVMYSGTVWAVFQNPLISVFPRLIIPISAYFAVLFARKIKIESKNKEIIANTLGAIAGVVTNTFLVLFMIFILYTGKNIHGTVIDAKWIMALITFNFTIEVIFCAIVSAPIINVLNKVIKK